MTIKRDMPFALGALAGFICGAAISLLQRHPTRRRIWVPIGFLPLGIANLVALADGLTWITGILAGGGMASSLAGSAGRTMHGVLLVGLAAAVVLMGYTELWTSNVKIVLASLCSVMFVSSLWLYRLHVGETLGEWPLRLMYRMRAVGPGVDQIPRTGPVLVIANHTAFLDPCWVMICLPRDLTPMMF